MIPRSIVCERVRAQVSLALDGESSELEKRMMESHIAKCGECAAYQRGIASVTGLLRDAPLERPRRPLEVHLPRRISVASLHTGAVAAVVAVAVVGLLGALGELGGARLPTVQSDRAPVRYETRGELTREQLILSGGRGYEGGPAVPV